MKHSWLNYVIVCEICSIWPRNKQYGSQRGLRVAETPTKLQLCALPRGADKSRHDTGTWTSPGFAAVPPESDVFIDTGTFSTWLICRRYHGWRQVPTWPVHRLLPAFVYRILWYKSTCFWRLVGWFNWHLPPKMKPSFNGVLSEIGLVDE